MVCHSLNNHTCTGFGKNILRGVLSIVQAGNDIIKADFMHTKRATFPTKIKIGIHLEELK